MRITGHLPIFSSIHVTIAVIVFLAYIFFVPPNNIEAGQPINFVVDQKEKTLPTNFVMGFYKNFYTYKSKKESNKWIKGFLNRLDKTNQITLAKVLITDPNTHLSSLAIILFLKNDRVDLAIPKLANMTLSGTDLSEFYWYLDKSESAADKEKILKKINDAIQHKAEK